MSGCLGEETEVRGDVGEVKGEVGEVGEVVEEVGEVKGEVGDVGEVEEAGERAESTESVVTVEFDRSTRR